MKGPTETGDPDALSPHCAVVLAGWAASPMHYVADAVPIAYQPEHQQPHQRQHIENLLLGGGVLAARNARCTFHSSLTRETKVTSLGDNGRPKVAGEPWDYCPRNALRRALAALESEYGVTMQVQHLHARAILILTREQALHCQLTASVSPA